jgi:beta-galactosidase
MLKMRKFLLASIALLTIFTSYAQSPRVYRSEFITYDKREDAVADKRDEIARYWAYKPERIAIAGGEIRFVQKITIDATLNDYNLFLHLENAGMAYTLFINNEPVAEVEDPITPADFMISPYMRQGVNEIMVGVRQTRTPQLQENIIQPQFPQFENSYMFAQRRLAVRDFNVILEPDSSRQYAKLKLDVIVANDFNFKETIQVGFDIYDPKGKLKEYSVNELEIEGRSIDTLHFNPDVYHSYNFKWGDGQKPLYDVMIYVKRNGMLWEYIPLKIGFGKTVYRDKKYFRFDQVLHIQKKVHFNADADRYKTFVAIEQLKLRGYNTLCPDYPQPKWFYDMCDKAGMFVIERMNLNSPTNSNIRTVGGTPANDPALLEEYMTRAKAMYYRSRNHSCIIAYNLGSENSGNGYNMYKVYEWIKSVETERPVFYEGAEGEWNTDL